MSDEKDIQLNINAADNGKPVEIILLKGEAQKPVPLNKKIFITGVIFAPLLFAKQNFNIEGSYPALPDGELTRSPLPGVVTYNYGLDGSNPFIKLDTNPAKPINGAEVVGTLIENELIDLLKINEDPKFSSAALISILTKTAGLFKNIEDVRGLIKSLRNLDIVFSTTVKQEDDRRGNVEAALKQEINFKKGELPTTLTIVAPLFYGTDPVTLTLEIEIDAASNGRAAVYSFYCLELGITKEATVKSIIDTEVEQLSNLFVAIQQA